MFIVSSIVRGSTCQAYAHIRYKLDGEEREAYLLDGSGAACLTQIRANHRMKNLEILKDSIDMDKVGDALRKKYRWVNAENYNIIMMKSNETAKKLLKNRMPWE